MHEEVDGKQIYLRLLRCVLPYWRLFALGLAAMVVLGISEPALAALLKPTFDGSFVEKDLSTVALMAVLLVVLFGVRGLASYFSALTLAAVSSRLVRDLRQQMFARLMALPTATLNVSTPGKLVSKITYDATQLTDAATHVVKVLVADSVMVVGLLGVMLYSMEGGMEALMKRFQDKELAKNAAPIQARSEYPAGGFYYADVDMAGYMAFAAQMLPDEPASAAIKQQMQVLFAGVPPVVSAGHKQDDRVRWSVKIPGDLIAKWGQFAMMMQMQQMQQQQGGMPSGVTVP